MPKSSTSHHWRLQCRCDDDCHWSRHVVIAPDAALTAELLVVLRAHADQARHGRRIEGVAVAVNGDVQVIVLRHP